MPENEPPLGEPIYDETQAPDAGDAVIQARIADPVVEQAEVTHVVITPQTAGSAGAAHKEN